MAAIGKLELRPRAAAMRLPRRHAAADLDLRRLIPSARVLVVAFALAAAAAGAYAAARSTDVFAVRAIEVRGASASVAGDVRRALEPIVGQSLVELRGAQVERLVEALPVVAEASYDRAFPNTLVVFVRAERPIAVVRRGAESWLVSGRGRAIARVPRGRNGTLPRVWVKKDVALRPGAYVTDATTARAIRALGPAVRGGFAPRIRTVDAASSGLAFVLASGVELRLGDERDLSLKLAVAEQILAMGDGGYAYLDVSLPDRPVSGGTLKSEVEVEG